MHGADLHAVQGVFLDKGNRVFNSANPKTSDLEGFGDMGLVRATETAGLNPGIREITCAFPAEKQHAADRGHLTPLMPRHQPQRFQVSALELAHRRKRLGSDSEVDRSRVAFRQCLLIIGFATRKTP